METGFKLERAISGDSSTLHVSESTNARRALVPLGIRASENNKLGSSCLL